MTELEAKGPEWVTETSNSLNDSSVNCSNATMLPPLPREMTFNDDNLVSVIAYTCMFVIAAVGNLTVFITLYRTRGIKSRVNTFIMHLAIADLIVTFIMLPLETAWHITVAWLAGDIACRILMFFRAFGFYLSSFVLVTISLDRYFSIVHPMSIHDADQRGKLLLMFAWLLSATASLPQSVIFHVESHPTYTWFEQCVTFNFFPTPTHELAYNLFNFIVVYVIPLAVITTSYAGILYKISVNARKAKASIPVKPYTIGKSCTTTKSLLGCPATSRIGKAKIRTLKMPVAEESVPTKQSTGKPSSTKSLLRCSTAGRIGKAKIRTLKMTLLIVSAFITCWTPYFVMLAMYWFHREDAKRVDSKLQRGLFLFAVSNSCVNPIIYGMFTTAFRREATKWRDWFKTRLSSIGLYTMQPSTIEQEYLA